MDESYNLNCNLSLMQLRSVAVDHLFNLFPIACGGSVFVFFSFFFWYALLCFLSSFAIILMRKRELIALILLS